MKSREGTVVDADDLIDEMEALAKRQATLEKAGDTPPKTSTKERRPSQWQH